VVDAAKLSPLSSLENGQS